MIIESALILAIIASICSADTTAFGQFMIGRPIFCGPLFGFLLGDITTGLWIGMIVEMAWTGSVPLGAAVPVDTTSIAILASYWAVKNFTGSQSAAMLALLLAVPVSYIHREIDMLGRNFNTKIMHWVEHGIEQGKEHRISLGLFTGLFLFLFRGFAFYFVFMVVGSWIFQSIYPQMNVVMRLALVEAWYIMPVVGFGVVLYNFKNIKIPFII
ncbi:MAG: PTS sugar transporter subunit IIC, partial [Elusimicrobia bacterium]|nr:PTS sugar transporter subunit IIC [Elusimicrobiota bacterium]